MFHTHAGFEIDLYKTNYDNHYYTSLHKNLISYFYSSFLKLMQPVSIY